MSDKFECGDNAALVTYLYDECDAAARLAIDAHLDICAACAAEVAALASTSMQLAAWTPPELDVDFRVVAEARAPKVLRPARWWRQPLPAWGQAAAAAAIFGVGVTLGVARGTLQTAPPAAAVAQAPGAATAVNVASRDDLAALEQRIRGELAQVRRVASAPAAVAPAPVVAGAAAAGDAQLLARVRGLIDESEQRQRRELALRTAALVRDLDAQRQFDFARIQRAFGQFEGTAGAEIQRQRQDLNNLIRVAGRAER